MGFKSDLKRSARPASPGAGSPRPPPDNDDLFTLEALSEHYDRQRAAAAAEASAPSAAARRRIKPLDPAQAAAAGAQHCAQDDAAAPALESTGTALGSGPFGPAPRSAAIAANRPFSLVQDPLDNCRLFTDLPPINPSHAYVVDEAGCLSFYLSSTFEILAACAPLLIKLRLQMSLSLPEFNQNFMPVLKRLAEECSVLPASAGYHDFKSTGLLQHSLFTAVDAAYLCARPQYRKSLPPGFDDKMILHCAVLEALLHDLGKICSDVEIYSDSGARFDPRVSSVACFAESTRTSCLHLLFVPGRGRAHREDSAELTAVRQRILDGIELPDLPDLNAFTRRVVYHADKAAVQSARQRGRHALYAPDFITGELCSALRRRGFCGRDLKSGIVMTQNGLFLASWSPLLQELSRRYAAVFELIDCDPVKDASTRFLTALRSMPLAVTPLLFRLRLWLKFFLRSPDPERPYFKAVFMQGVLIALPQELAADSPITEALILGQEPGEIAPLLTAWNQRRKLQPAPPADHRAGALGMVIVPQEAYCTGADPLPWMRQAGQQRFPLPFEAVGLDFVPRRQPANPLPEGEAAGSRKSLKAKAGEVSHALC